MPRCKKRNLRSTFRRATLRSDGDRAALPRPFDYRHLGGADPRTDRGPSRRQPARRLAAALRTLAVAAAQRRVARHGLPGPAPAAPPRGPDHAPAGAVHTSAAAARAPPSHTSGARHDAAVCVSPRAAAARVPTSAAHIGGGALRKPAGPLPLPGRRAASRGAPQISRLRAGPTHRLLRMVLSAAASRSSGSLHRLVDSGATSPYSFARV